MSKFYARGRLSILAALTGLIASVGLFNSPTASAALPTPVSGATARTYLASLTVKAENRTGYDRDLFPTWITISGTCNTREYILKRDGTNVVTNSACTATSGSWYSPTTAPPGPPPPTSTSTTWSRSPRPGTPGRAPGPPPSARASPTTSPARS